MQAFRWSGRHLQSRLCQWPEPLRLFSERLDFSSRSIGYGKSAMVFHMLRRMMGDETFFTAMKEFVQENTFRVASWDDLRRVMEKRSGNNLTWFFRQWVDGTGLPALRVQEVMVKPVGKKFELSFTLAQKGKVFKLLVPLTFYFQEGSQKQRVTLAASKERFAFVLEAKPEELVIDEDYDVFRQLTAAENPPTVERLATGKNIAVLPAIRDGNYHFILTTLKQEAVSVKIVEPEAVSKANRASSLIIFGRDHPLIGRILGNLDLPEEGFSITVRKDPKRPDRLVTVIHCSPGEKVDTALKDVLHYPFFSNYLFRQGERVNQTLEETERGIRVKLAQPEMK
ncbi:MAG: M1 family aminopeptidase [Desulfobaccales bacterium]